MKLVVSPGSLHMTSSNDNIVCLHRVVSSLRSVLKIWCYRKSARSTPIENEFDTKTMYSKS